MSAWPAQASPRGGSVVVVVLLGHERVVTRSIGHLTRWVKGAGLAAVRDHRLRKSHVEREVPKVVVHVVAPEPEDDMARAWSGGWL